MDPTKLICNFQNPRHQNEMEYSFKVPRRQYFSLPFFVISYLIETQSVAVLLKLQQSCKYFFGKKPVIVANEDLMCKFDEEKNGIMVLDEDLDNDYLLAKAQYWFTQLKFYGNNFCANLRPHVYRLNLSSLTVYVAELTLNDLDFLLSNNEMEDLCLLEIDICDADGNAVPLDYVLRKVPNVVAVSYENMSDIYSNQTWENLNSIKFNNKLSLFCVTIHHTSEKLTHENIGKFIENNVESRGYVELIFPSGAPEIEPMKAKFQQIADNWMPRGAAPKFIVDEIHP